MIATTCNVYENVIIGISIVNWSFLGKVWRFWNTKAGLQKQAQNELGSQILLERNKPHLTRFALYVLMFNEQTNQSLPFSHVIGRRTKVTNGLDVS